MTAVISQQEGQIWGDHLEYSPHQLIKKAGIHNVDPSALPVAEAEPVPVATKWRAIPIKNCFATPRGFFGGAKTKQFFGLRQLLLVHAMGPRGIGGVAEIVSSSVIDESAYVIHQRSDGIKTLNLRPVADLFNRDVHILIPVW
mgnify:CR=1 FL=1